MNSQHGMADSHKAGESRGATGLCHVVVIRSVAARASSVQVQQCQSGGERAGLHPDASGSAGRVGLGSEGKGWEDDV
jgi:hypothetical protein